MKAISIWQPWASAIAAGVKLIETRGWPVDRAGLEIPQRIAIHASKRWTGDEVAFYAEHVLKNDSVRAAFVRVGSDPMPPLGCIVATATLYGCRRTDDLLSAGMVSELEQEFGNFSLGRFGWLLQDVQPITPVPYMGRQGFFDWNPS